MRTCRGTSKKTADETGHAKPRELKELISTTIKDRNDLILAGGIGFEDSYVEDFEQKLTDILGEMEKDAVENKSIYSGSFERALVNRLHKYRENYFAWVRDFTIPTTNNLAERAFRGVKTKMKVAGQFSSSRSANYYAKIRSYIETSSLGKSLRMQQKNKPYKQVQQEGKKKCSF